MRGGILALIGIIAIAIATVLIIWLVRVPDMYEVRGEAFATYVPDEVEITSSIYIESDVSLDAVKEAASTMRNIIAAVKTAGIAEKDIKTAEVQSGLLDDSNERNRDSSAKKTYFAEQAIVISLKDVAQTAKVLDTVARAGSNFWRVRYQASDRLSEQLRAQTRKQALLNAIATADSYAREGQFKRGRVLKILDEAVDFPEIDYPGRSYRTMRVAPGAAGGSSGDRVEKVTVTGTRVGAIPDSTFNIPPPRERQAAAQTHVLFEIE